MLSFINNCLLISYNTVQISNQYSPKAKKKSSTKADPAELPKQPFLTFVFI